MKTGNSEIGTNILQTIYAISSTDVKLDLGLFSPTHLMFELERRQSSNATEPSLEEMTVKAVEILRKNNDGYLLLVECRLFIGGAFKVLSGGRRSLRVYNYDSGNGYGNIDSFTSYYWEKRLGTLGLFELKGNRGRVVTGKL